MTIVPGFTDCHNHAPGNDAALRGARRQPVRGRVRDHRQHRRQAARESAGDAAGHVGRGLLLRRHQGARTSAQLNVHDLDEVSKDHPVVVQHRGGHTSFYNSKALEMAGINEEHAESAGRNVRPRRDRRSQRTRHRSRARRRSAASASVRRSPRTSGCSATATAWRTSPSSSSATA